MRYKSMPLATRNSTPTPSAAPPSGSRIPQRWWVDWLLTLPVLLLIPVILVPILVRGAGPSLSVQGQAIAGQEIVVDGSGFPSGNKLRLAWDATDVEWLPTPKVKGDGSFVVTAVLPADTATGPHLLAAELVRGKGQGSNARVNVLASLTVQVSTAASQEATPTPRATPTPTPTPSQTSKPTPTPTASSSSQPTQPAGDGKVVGYGAGTVGGSGGRQLVVTNLADSGPGSLRAALEASGPRIVVFDVAGTISLQGSIHVKNPNLTIAGETAPSPGITVRGGSLLIRTSEVIVRDLRLRPGDGVPDPNDVDAMTLNGVNEAVSNVLVDHVTMLWGPDIGGLAILGDVRNVTIQNSIMGEGLYLSAHSEATAAQGGHSMAANVTQLDPGLADPRRITFWRNLFTTSDTRMPRFQGAECVDVVNNVMYNWGIKPAHGNPRSLNLVNNWFRAGPLTQAQQFWQVQTSIVSPHAFDASVYTSGNFADGIQGGRESSATVYADSPRCGGMSVTPGDPHDAYAAVVDGAGAILPVRDAVDRRVIANVVDRTGRSFFNGAGYPGPNPYWP
jgi:pectate lyase